MHEQKLKHAHLTQKGESGLMTGRGSMLTEGNIVLLEYFCFHIVKPLMQLLALLPMLCVCEKKRM